MTTKKKEKVVLPKTAEEQLLSQIKMHKQVVVTPKEMSTEPSVSTEQTPPKTPLVAPVTIDTTPTIEIEPHWVCTGGCGKVSKMPGRCESVGCFRNKNPYTTCTCTDNKHGNLLDLNNPNKKEA